VTTALWITVALLLALLVALQLAAARGLAEIGVRPSPAVVALRIVNLIAVVAVVAVAFWKWVS
jgi:hypothetical protein